MKVCILGNNLTALTLAKTLVNLKINVEILYIKKNLDFNKTRTIGVSKSNIDFFNKKIISINPLLWKINKIDIYSDKLDKEKLISFGKDNEIIFSIIKSYNLYKVLKNHLSKNKFYKSKLFDKKFFSTKNRCK